MPSDKKDPKNTHASQPVNSPANPPAQETATVENVTEAVKEFISLLEFQSILKNGPASKDLSVFATALLLDSALDSPSKKLTEITATFPLAVWHPFLLQFSGITFEIGKTASKKTTKNIEWSQINNAVANARIHYAALDEYKYSLSPENRPTEKTADAPKPADEVIYLMNDYPTYPASVKTRMVAWEFTHNMTGMTDADFAALVLKYHPETRDGFIALHAAEKAAAEKASQQENPPAETPAA